MVTICRKPSCTCPDHAKGNLCKHIVQFNYLCKWQSLQSAHFPFLPQLFIMLKVLRINSESPYLYQVALVPSELQEIFSKAPKDPASVLVRSTDVTLLEQG